jgi:transcription termination/antitermination protein NusG
MDMANDLRSTDYARIQAEQAAREATEREAERRRRLVDRASGQEKWYLARESSRFNEERADEIFASYGVETYTPKSTKLVPVPLNRIPPKQRKNGFRPREPRMVPLFPGFRLLHLDFRRDDWREIFDRAKLCGIIGTDHGGRLLPRPVPEQALDVFRKREKEGFGSVTVRDLGFSIGEAVRISDGHMSGFPGTVDELPDIAIDAVDDDVRIRLLVMVFGRATPVEIPLSHIEKI